MKILLDGVVEGFRTRQDGSVVLALASQEIDSTMAGNLMMFRNKYVKCLLSDTNVSALEEKLVDEEKMTGGKKPKSPGQRLRAVMYRVWEQEHGGQGDFETYYKGQMETIIGQYKEVLDRG